MRAALAGTSQAQDRNKSAFALYASEVPRVSSWASAVPHDLYLLGNWRGDFVVTGVRVESLNVTSSANATVQLAATVPHGIGWKYSKAETGCGCEPFYALNALELVTEPLECKFPLRHSLSLRHVAHSLPLSLPLPLSKM